MPGTHHPALFAETFFTEECHWIKKPPRQLLTDQMYDCKVMYQHVQLHGPENHCTLTLSGGNSLIVSLDRPMRAIAAGQYAVFYDGEVCLGGAKILRTGPSMYTMGVREQMTKYMYIDT